MMDNNRKTLNKREILMGHAYVFLFFFLTTVACCLAIFMWNSDFRMFEQKEFVKIKMNRIKDFQQEQAESQMPVDSLFRKIEAFQPGVYAQYEEDDIHGVGIRRKGLRIPVWKRGFIVIHFVYRKIGEVRTYVCGLMGL